MSESLLSSFTVFPRHNNNVVEFCIPPNNHHVLLNGVTLHFTIEIDEISEAGVDLIPQNYFGPKQMSSLEIRVNGEPLTQRSTANEYYLGSYFHYLVNYAKSYTTTACKAFGVFDYRNLTTAGLTSTLDTSTKLATFVQTRKNFNNKYIYEIIMPIDSTIFYSNSVLPSNTQLDLSFERADAIHSALLSKQPSSYDISNIAKIFELEDIFLTVPYIDDEKMFSLEKTAISKPIKISYDEYTIQRFNIPRGSPNVRMPNLLNGKLPQALFWGIMKETSYTGSFEMSSTLFKRYDQKKACLYLDGNPVPGYPVRMSADKITQPYMRFIDMSNKYLNVYSSSIMDLYEYNSYHFLHAVKFSNNTTGSLTFDFEFEKTIADDYILITCAIFDRNLLLDNFRNFKVD